MPLISPPNQYGIPEPEPQSELTDWEDNRRIELFLDIKPWRCQCGNTNFGRNRYCADFRCKAPRPSDWKFEKR